VHEETARAPETLVRVRVVVVRDAPEIAAMTFAG